MPSGIQMSFTPWRETAFLSNAFNTPRPPNENGSSVSSSSKGTSINCDMIMLSGSAAQKKSRSEKSGKTFKDVAAGSCEMFDKRFILRTMQNQCSVEFLRKHYLSGSEDLVLKKRNKASILSAYDEWRNMKNVSDSRESELTTDCTALESDRRGSVDTSSSRLVDTFTVLYNRSRSTSTLCSKTTVLLLHEDYPEELPIFSTDHSKKSHALDNSNKKDRSPVRCKVSIGSSNYSHRVICVLGAVRDASDVEIEAAISGKIHSHCF